jgi:hypothetical protein
LSFHALVNCDAGAAPIPTTAADQLSQLLARIEHPRFHRGHRNAKDFANLFCRLSVIVDEIDHLAMLLNRQCAAHSLGAVFFLRRDLGIVG